MKTEPWHNHVDAHLAELVDMVATESGVEAWKVQDYILTELFRKRIYAIAAGELGLPDDEETEEQVEEQFKHFDAALRGEVAE